MTIPRLSALLGASSSHDPGCEAGFEHLDEYCDAVLRGEDVSVRFAGMISHIRSCPDCREDTASLLAALTEMKLSPDQD